MKKKITLSILTYILILFWTYSWGQTDNFVYEPQNRNSGPRFPAKISNVLITVEPKGLFNEFSYFFDYSVEDVPVPPGTLLNAESSIQFRSETTVNDFWLWVNNEVHRAKLVPSLALVPPPTGTMGTNRYSWLFHQYWYQHYKLTIDRLYKGEPNRRFKITVLQPNLNWQDNSTVFSLPNFGPGPYQYRVFLKPPWLNPQLSNTSTPQLTLRKEEKLGEFYETLPISEQSAKLTLQTQSPKGTFVGLTPARDGERIYQFSVNLDKFLDSAFVHQERKILVLLHIKPNTDVATIRQLKAKLISELQAVLQPNDLFNVLSETQGTPVWASRAWIPARPDSIKNAIDNISSGGLNLPGSIINALDYIKNNGKYGKIFLLANTDDEYEPTATANALGAIKNTKGNLTIPFFIFDFVQNARRWGGGSSAIYGNASFYGGLSALDKGSFQYLTCNEGCNDPNWRWLVNRCYNWIPQTSISFASSSNPSSDVFPIPALEFTTTTRDPIIRPAPTSFNYLGTTYAETGKIKGNPPYFITVNSTIGDSLFRQSVPIEPSLIYTLDSTAWQAWAGAKIRTLTDIYFIAARDKNTPQIVELSLNEHVLSRATSFIDYDPNDPTIPCSSCIDRSLPLSTSSSHPSLDSLIAFKVTPNPFVDRVQIQLQFKEPMDLSQAKVSIYDRMGRLVRTFAELPQGRVRELNFLWDGLDQKYGNLPTGLYIFRLSMPQGQVGVKLMKL